MFRSSHLILEVICDVSPRSLTQDVMDLDHGTCRLSTPLTLPDVMIDDKLTDPMGVSTLLVRYSESAVRVEQGNPYLASLAHDTWDQHFETSSTRFSRDSQIRNRTIIPHLPCNCSRATIRRLTAEEPNLHISVRQ